MKIQVVNHLKGLDDEVMKIVEVKKYYADMVCVDHDLGGCEVLFEPGAEVAKPGYFPLGMFDSADISDALGYHDVDPEGRPYGKVFRDMIPGGEMLHDPTGHGMSAACVAGHELAEMLGDLFANLWAVGDIVDPARPTRTFSLIAKELCDPCQDASFTLRAKDGTLVDCSDYALANFFNPRTPSGEKTSHMGTTKGPMVCGPGGYLIVAQEKGETQVFGRKLGQHHDRIVHPHVAPPAWREAIRALTHSRSGRRALHAHG